MAEDSIHDHHARFRAGDPEVFERLFREYSDAIYRFVLFKVSRKEDAEDLTQTAFVKAWERREQFGGKGTLKAWLFQIARHVVIDFYRTRKRVEELPEQVTDHGKNYLMMDTHIDHERLLDQIRSLEPQEYGEVLIHRFVNELSVEETAEAMGKSAGAIRILQHRALAAIRKRLEEQE